MSTTSVTEETQKRLSLAMSQKDPEIKLSPNADIITLEADETDPRALMPCGHAITPASLTQHMHSLVTSQHDYIIRCCALKDPQASTSQLEHARTLISGSEDVWCRVEWSYPLCRKIALLTPSERAYFEKQLSMNFATDVLDIKQCPRCPALYYRDQRDPPTNDNVKTTCIICKTCEFCWRCGMTWKMMNSKVVCGNDTCIASIAEMVKILASCPIKRISSMNVPSVRACPNPSCYGRGTPQLIEHTSGCKHMKCPSCLTSFCHACLQLHSPRMGWPTSCGGSNDTCQVAPRQTKQQIQVQG